MSLTPILILSTHLRFKFLNQSLSFTVPTKTVYVFLFFLIKPHVSATPPSLVRAFLLCDIKLMCSPWKLTLILVTSQTEVSGQTHDSVPSPPEKEATVPTDQETGWKPRVWTFSGRRQYLSLQGVEPRFLMCPAPSPLTALTIRFNKTY